MGRRLFAELTAARAADRTGATLDAASRRLEVQQVSQLLNEQQENFAASSRLNDLATQRIIDAQGRLLLVIVAGLLLLASVIAGASWLLRRGVLTPLARLQQATRQIAAGNLDFVLGLLGGRRVDAVAGISTP